MPMHRITESTTRKLAGKHGARISKSRKAQNANNYGEYMVIDINTNAILAGEKYDMTLEDVVDFFTPQD